MCIFFILFISLNVHFNKNSFEDTSVYDINNILNWQKKEFCAGLENFLQVSPIDSFISLKEYFKKEGIQDIDTSSTAYVVFFINGMKGIFKPDEDNDYYLREARWPHSIAETAAYRISCLLGFPFIPPTTVRKIDNKLGSLQFMVPNAISFQSDICFFKKLYDDMPLAFKDKIIIFNYVFGQWDSRIEGNLLFYNQSEVYYPISIDNEHVGSLLFSLYGGPLYTRLTCTYNSNGYQEFSDLSAFPFDTPEIIIKESPSQVKETLISLYGKNFHPNFFKYANFYAPMLEYIIYKKRIWRRMSFINYTKSMNVEIMKALYNIVNEDIVLIYHNLSSNGKYEINFNEMNEALQQIIERKKQVFITFKDYFNI